MYIYFTDCLFIKNALLLLLCCEADEGRRVTVQ